MLKIITDALSSFVPLILSIFPRSPFSDYIQGLAGHEFIHDYVGWINWFFPVGAILPIFALWLTAISTFQMSSILARWARIIE